MYSLIGLDIVDSTNSWAKRNLASFRGDETTVITARGQTSGRGRFDRSWVSPPDQNLYLTFVERVRLCSTPLKSTCGKDRELHLMHYSQATALAIAQVLRRYAIHATIKWPNDILVDGKKICGILVESTSRGDEPWVIVGVGLNVCMEGELLASIDQPATSMQELLGKPIALEEVQHLTIDSVLAAFLWAQTDPSQCQRQYVAHSRIMGKEPHPP